MTTESNENTSSRQASLEPRKKKSHKNEIDILDAARKHKEAAEALAIAERESLLQSLEGMDISAIRNLAVVEEMEIKPREPTNKIRHGEQSDRWDDRWNGRKNFKKFRPKGARASRERVRVIVPVEEVKSGRYGVGQDYWGDEEDEEQALHGARKASSNTLRDSGDQTSSARLSNADVGHPESHGLFVTQTSQAVHEISDDEGDASLPVVPSMRSTRSQQTEHSSIGKASSANMSLSNTSKRPAQTTLTKKGTTKKPRVQDSDDSEDELRFRFRKKA